METTNQTTVVGVFQDHAFAQHAINELHNAGFTDDQIGFAARTGGTDEGDLVTGERANEAGQGAIAGGVVGGLAGAAASLLIPGFGPAIAGGILLATLGGIVLGTAAGGLIGALVGMGVSEEQAHYYQSEFEQGRTVVTVLANGRENDALAILRRNGATDANSRFGQSTDPDFIASNRQDALAHSETTVPAGEEEVSTGSFFEQPVEPGIPGQPGTPFEQESQIELGASDDPSLRGPRV